MRDRFSPAVKEEALRMMAAGTTMRETAKATGASLSSLTNWKRAAGQRSRGGRGRKPAAAASVSSAPLGKGAVAALAAVVNMNLSKQDLAMLKSLLNAYLA
jgi:transposase-like protein